jgi:uncharacterized protein (TIGR03083 family)
VTVEPSAQAGSPVVGLLVAEWATIAGLLEGLDASDWSAPTALPHWTVHDVVAHLIGTESSLEGIDAPEPAVDVAALDHVHNRIGAQNEHWVQALRSKSPEEMLVAFVDVTSRRGAALSELSAEDFAAPSWTPVGQGTYERFMQIRLFDCWLHEQDIRSAVGRPGHADGPCAEAAIDEIRGALGYVMGKQVGVPDGLAVTIELTGPVSRVFHIVVDGRAALVPELDRPAAAAVRLSSGLFADLAGGRTSAADHRDDLILEGDQELAWRMVEKLAFTI